MPPIRPAGPATQPHTSAATGSSQHRLALYHTPPPPRSQTPTPHRLPKKGASMPTPVPTSASDLTRLQNLNANLKAELEDMHTSLKFKQNQLDLATEKNEQVSIQLSQALAAAGEKERMATRHEAEISRLRKQIAWYESDAETRDARLALLEGRNAELGRAYLSATMTVDEAVCARETAEEKVERMIECLERVGEEARAIGRRAHRASTAKRIPTSSVQDNTPPNSAQNDTPLSGAQE